MAQYKVPQDVEADDKLIGPFSFRQFVYLLIAFGLGALAFGLFQIFPLLAVIPVPFILLLLALALPLKKDQPMETYLAALISYFLKPRVRLWRPGQRESTIMITAPKVVDTSLARDLTEEEASRRLSFLAEIVDTGGYAIKGASNSSVREDLLAEANQVNDMFDSQGAGDALGKALNESRADGHAAAVDKMKTAINLNESIADRTIRGHGETEAVEVAEEVVAEPQPRVEQGEAEKPDTFAVKQGIMDLAHNEVFSVGTIQKRAEEINKGGGDEVFVSLH